MLSFFIYFSMDWRSGFWCPYCEDWKEKPTEHLNYKLKRSKCMKKLQEEGTTPQEVFAWCKANAKRWHSLCPTATEIQRLGLDVGTLLYAGVPVPRALTRDYTGPPPAGGWRWKPDAVPVVAPAAPPDVPPARPAASTSAASTVSRRTPRTARRRLAPGPDTPKLSPCSVSLVRVSVPERPSSETPAVKKSPPPAVICKSPPAAVSPAPSAQKTPAMICKSPLAAAALQSRAYYPGHVAETQLAAEPYVVSVTLVAVDPTPVTTCSTQLAAEPHIVSITPVAAEPTPVTTDMVPRPFTAPLVSKPRCQKTNPFSRFRR